MATIDEGGTLTPSTGKTAGPEGPGGLTPQGETYLWEILVPCVRNEGRPFRLRYHRVWDRFVMGGTGGLTIMPVTKGRWLAPAGTLYAERMIPVRFIGTIEDMKVVAEHTKRYYDPLAVFVSKVSSEGYLL